MSLSTYADLQADVKDWLHRSDLDSRIPKFIALAEMKIKRRLRISDAEVEIPIVATPNSRYIVKPDSFIRPIALWLTVTQPRQMLTFVLPEQLPVSQTVSMFPKYWAIDGANIAFELAASGALTFDCRYLKGYVLSDAAPTNPLYALAPDLYLFGAVLEATPWLVNDKRIPTWQAKFEESMRDVANSQNTNKELASLRTEIPVLLRSGYGYDIRRGF